MQTTPASPLTGQDQLTQSLRAIALRARTLEERLNDASGRQADGFSEHGLRRWRRAAGGDEKLRQRLGADGYDEDDARRALGSPAQQPSEISCFHELPAWAQRLGDVLEAADDGVTPVERFRQDALRRLGPCEALTPPALAALEARLVANLEALTKPVKPAVDAGRDLVDIFGEYSVLARHLVRLCDTWVGAARELDERLAADRELLATEFGAWGVLTGLRAGLSDRHGGGRQVCELQFASGMSVIYKPRSLEAEAAFQGVLDDLSAELGELTPPRLKVCRRDGYGWMETALHAPLGNPQQARLAFQRAGSLLFITWLLGANDLHTGNVVATAEGPVIVDLETLLQGPPEGTAQGPGAQAEGALLRARQRLKGSLLSTGLLSFPRRDAEDRFFDIGGLLGDGEHNRFQLHGEELCPEDFGAELEHGFEQAFYAASQAGMARRLVERLRSVRPRRVLRSSQGYAYLLGRLTSADGLRDGFSAGLMLESLGGHADDVRVEKASLHGLDVPAFDSEPGKGIEAMEQRWRGLDGATLRQQLEILRAALGRSDGAATAGAASVSTPALVRTGTINVRSADLELSTALEFGQCLRDRAVVGDDGSVTWLTVGAVRIAGRRDRGMSYHLYDGGVGIALFLAALARATDDGDWADLARAALRPVEAVLASPIRDELVRREALGSGSGIGSIVYGTTLISQLLGDDGILDTALRTARLITPERIATDDRFDVEGGAAGALLGLRALHRVVQEPWLRRSMGVCAEHVLDRLRSAPDGVQPGFGHGASGLAYALLALAEVDDAPRWIEGARQAMLLERDAYDASQKNWRSIDGTARNAWCHGAPGIALARAAAHGRVDEPWVEQDLRLALGTTLRGAKASLDAPTVEHLCCGRFGRLDILLEAGCRFRRADLVQAARSIARQRLQASVRFAEDDHPGFFRGLSGLGYTLLRFRDAEAGRRLPSVLAFETMERPS